ncbi:hypothetical protein [Pseudomonas sp. LB3P25]
MILPEDYGGFAPRFFGVTIRLHSERDFAYLDDYISGRLHDAEDRSLKVISLKSVMQHEVRHYHDFLISPYGSFVFRAKLQAAIHGCALLGLLNELPGEWLPAPVTAWCSMEEQERQKCIAEWRAELGTGISFVELPNLNQIDCSKVTSSAEISLKKSDPNAAIAFLAHSVRQSYYRVKDLTQGMMVETSAPELTPCNFFEVLALSTQLQSIRIAQSADCAQVLWAMLEESNASYAKLWRRVLALVNGLSSPRHSNNGSPNVLDQIVSIVLWCTLGNFMIDNIRACPNVRFLLLENFLKTRGCGEDIANDVVPVWRRWDEALGLPSWRDGVEHAMGSNKLHGARLEQSQNGGIGLVASEIFRNFCEQQELLVQTFLLDPNILVNQERYVNLAGGAGLPKPITRLEMSGFQISCPSGGAWISIWEDRPHSPVSQMVLRGDHFSDDFVDYAINLERIILLSDMIMAGHEPPRGINRFALDDITRFAGKKPIWIV